MAAAAEIAGAGADMDDLLEALLEPIAEAVVGLFCEGFGSISGEGSIDPHCRVETLFGNSVRWDESARN